MFISCKKQDQCEQNNLGNVSFTLTDLQINPYLGTETLSFSDSLGNSMTFSGEESFKEYNQHYQYPSTDPNACWGDYFNTEYRYTIFQGKNKNSVIEINLNMDSGSPFHQNINKFLNITIRNDVNININGSQYSRFNNLILYTVHNTFVIYKDSLKIGSKVYKSVYILTNGSDVPTQNNNLQTLFYNIKIGILGFKITGGKTWYLN
jgi:hypothetical protein